MVNLKHSLVTVLLFGVFGLHAQSVEKIFYTKEGRITTADSGYYFTLGSKIQEPRAGGSRETFFTSSGRPRSLETFDSSGLRTDLYHEYYEDGSVKETSSYVMGRPSGDVRKFYPG